jgi:diguanylate cyclase (GGDEF)-like protein
VSVFKSLKPGQMHLLKTAIESIEDGFSVFNAQLSLVLCNKKFKELYLNFEDLSYLGLTLEKFLRTNISSGFYLFDDVCSDNMQQDIKNIEQKVKMDMMFYQHAQTPYLQKLKDNRWLEITNSPIVTGGIVSIHKDITARKIEEEKLTYLARHDSLTGLFNRSFFKHRLCKVIEQAQKIQGRFALIYLDLNQFKRVNDTLGHKAGDELLTIVAGQILRTVRKIDFVARIGGDEFVVLLPEIESELEVMKIRNRLSNAIQGHFPLKPSTVSGIHYTLSAGMAVYPNHGETLDALFAYADAAMYKSKKATQPRYSW